MSHFSIQLPIVYSGIEFNLYGGIIVDLMIIQLAYCVKSEDRVAYPGIKDFLSRSWTKLIEILDQRSRDLNTHKENAIHNIQNNQSPFHPVTYDDDNHEIIEVVVELLVESLLHSFVFFFLFQ